MRLDWLILAGPCVWRFTHLLNLEDGPWDAVVWLRRAAGDTFWGKLLDCFYCLSLWVAIPFALLVGETWREWLLAWPALSTFAIVLEHMLPASPPLPPRAIHVEDKEPDY
ncbi:MAG TPA: hypothetical protein VL486_03490 [Verrucomicrobiae bacterium]|nr:hypothetical protein [Verrucomicrobiae bacterium]